MAGQSERGYLLVLGIKQYTYHNRKTDVWLKVKNLKGRKFWILQSDDLKRVEPLSDNEMEMITSEIDRFKKIKTANEFELLKGIKTDSFSLSARFEMKKVFYETLPVFEHGIVLFKDPKTDETESAYAFPNCSALQTSLREKLDYETTGSDPFLVRYNKLFAEMDGKLLTNGFMEYCKKYVDENTAPCGVSGNSFETLVSKVGSLAAFESGSMKSEGCGGLYTSTSFDSIDLKTGKSAELTDFFDEEDLFKALQEDAYVQSKIKEAKPDQIDTLKKLSDYIRTGGFAVYEDKFRQGRLRIRISVPADTIHWVGYTLLGLDVKPNYKFLNEFQNLDRKKELFLAKTQKNLSVP